MKIEQLPSRHFKKEGKFNVEYTVQLLDSGKTFTKLKPLWEDALGEGIEVKFNKGLTKVSWCEVTDFRAKRYTNEELNRIFEDVVYCKPDSFALETSARFLVKEY